MVVSVARETRPNHPIPPRLVLSLLLVVPPAGHLGPNLGCPAFFLGLDKRDPSGYASPDKYPLRGSAGRGGGIKQCPEGRRWTGWIGSGILRHNSPRESRSGATAPPERQQDVLAGGRACAATVTAFDRKVGGTHARSRDLPGLLTASQQHGIDWLLAHHAGGRSVPTSLLLRLAALKHLESF